MGGPCALQLHGDKRPAIPAPRLILTNPLSSSRWARLEAEKRLNVGGDAFSSNFSACREFLNEWEMLSGMLS